MQPFTFFISYRREDTAPIALLLKHEIEKRLRFVRVSVDVEEIRIGEEFPERIRNLIDEAHATIALIGKHWMPRLDAKQTVQKKPLVAAANTEDWIVEELQYSRSSKIQHPKIDRYNLSERKLIPLFVNCDARFDQFDVPESIADLAPKQAERIDYASWPMAIVPLIDRIAVHLNLKTRPDNEMFPVPDIAKASTQPLSDAELIAILKYEDYQGWYIDNFGDAEARYMVKTFEFTNFSYASRFMQLVSNHCEVLDHHPDWRNLHRYVTVSLTTWDARCRVTIYDLNLALFMNKAAKIILKKQDS